MPYGHVIRARAMVRPGLMGRMGQGALSLAGAAGQAYSAFQSGGGSVGPGYAGNPAGVAYTGRSGGYRRMNVCNPKALRRAIRRTHAFAKLAMKTIHLVHPTKKGRFGGFRKRRRRG